MPNVFKNQIKNKYYWTNALQLQIDIFQINVNSIFLSDIMCSRGSPGFLFLFFKIWVSLVRIWQESSKGVSVSRHVSFNTQQYKPKNFRKQIRYASVQAAENTAQLRLYSHCDRYLIYDLCILA